MKSSSTRTLPVDSDALHEHGHDCVTIREEGLEALTIEVLKAAVAEGRILVTNDHDFGNVLVYPPEDTAGIVVLNPPGRVSMGLLRRLVIAFLEALAREDVYRKLWIVEPGRIREHQSSRWSDEEDSSS